MHCGDVDALGKPSLNLECLRTGGLIDTAKQFTLAPPGGYAERPRPQPARCCSTSCLLQVVRVLHL